MNIAELMEWVEPFFTIDETRLGEESLNTSKIYGKVLRQRTIESMTLKSLNHQLKALYQSKRDYYMGRADPEVYKQKPFDLKVLKSEVNTYIEADEEVVTLLTKIEIQEEKVAYLQDALKQISNRGFAIKNALEYQKMMNGGY
jgi:hypothetical protein